MVSVFQASPILRTVIIVAVGSKYRETLRMVLCRRNAPAANHQAAQQLHQAAPPAALHIGSQNIPNVQGHLQETKPSRSAAIVTQF